MLRVRSLFAALALAGAVACGGGGSTTTTPVAAPTATPTAMATAMPTAAATATPTAVATATPTAVATATPTAAATATPTATPAGTGSNTVFNFTGSTAAGSATFNSVAGGSLTFGPYAGLSLSSTWGSITNFTTAVAMQGWLASGNGDITSTSSIAFPAFATTPHQNASGAALPGTFNLVGYLKFQATPESTFAQTPAFTLGVAAPASVVGTGCSLFSITNTGSNSAPILAWKQAVSATTVSSTQINFSATTLPTGQTADVSNPTVQAATGNGPSYLAVACS